MVASAESLKSPFVHAKHIRTHSIRATHVSKKLKIAFFIPRIAGDCSTHRNCSHLFHICSQREIGSSTGGDFHGG